MTQLFQPGDRVLHRKFGEGTVQAVVGAGALVTKNTVVPPFSVVLGSPGKVVKTLPESSLEQRKEQAMHYHGLAIAHRRMLSELK